MGNKNGRNKKEEINDNKIEMNEKTEGEKGEEEKKNEPQPIPFFRLFHYSSPFDKGIIFVGVLASISLGAGLPALMIFMGNLMDTFINFEFWKAISSFNGTAINETLGDGFANDTVLFNYLKDLFKTFDPPLDINQVLTRTQTNESEFVTEIRNVFLGELKYVETFKDESNFYSLMMGAVGLAFLILSYIMVACLAAAANNQAHRIRNLFFKSILRQDIAWYDTKTSGDFASKVTADLGKIQNGIGDKVALCIFSFSTVLFSLGTAFYYGWELTLIILSVMPVLIIAFSIIGKIQAKFSTTEAASYSKAGAVAEEVLGAIRTVYAFDGQQKEINRYEGFLAPAKESGEKRTIVTGIGLGTMWLCIYASYGLAFWYGVRLIVRSIENQNQDYLPSTMMIVFFTVLMGAFSVGQASPYFEAFNQARGAAALVFEVIERKPLIDSSSDEGIKLKNLDGQVEFKDVHFNYPARADVTVLKGLNLIAKPGETVALVGPSGCGKSTVIQLIQRFYDVDSGSVLIDGKDIRSLNVGWLRDQIGVVGQEPVLFGCSIAENIKLGYSAATQKDIESASIDANAHDFIMRLPHQFHTLVGERGSQLSGGQKQRIAIARALIRQPKILLLDESTSALDLQSESIVQAALDRASVGRTTFIVAHRLSTIRNADKIIVINDGKVHEIGTHKELMNNQGLYFQLVQTQQQNDDETKDPNLNDVNTNRHLISRAFSVESNPDGKIVADDVAETPQNVHKKEEEESPPIMRLASLLTPDKFHVLTGCLCAVLMGLTIPAFALLFGEILGVLSKTDVNEIQKDVGLYSALFVVIGVLSGIASFLQIYTFGVSGERMTLRLRRQVFTSMLRQEPAWFDDPSNSTGALCARLSSDAASVQGAAGSRLSTLTQAISTLGAAIVIALIFSWKLGLVVMCFIPIVIASTYFQMVITTGQLKGDKVVDEESTRIAVEAIGSIRTVASLHQEAEFIKKYNSALATQFRKSRIRAHLRGITFGLAQSAGNFSYAIALFYGSKLIIDGEINYANLFKVVEAVIFGTAMVGHAVAFAPDYHKGKIAAVHIFKLLDRQPKINVNYITGESPKACHGNVEFRGVEFTYPTRPNAKILRGLSFNVEKGQTVALVGSSGCGKSTCIQLLERFYDCDGGEVCIDGRNILNLNIPWLRKQFGIVSQEPVLFGYSIGENIAYGDNSRTVDMQEIVRAAEKANIHEFIKSLPNGYETPVGDKGTQLSGGQKQRIAIARAMVRNPEILLLDEATSALDSESEKVVQAALDEARQGRTCIVIAHRLSTIHNADKIVVINKGLVVEEGNHHDLIARKGPYFQLYNVQS